MRQKYSWKGLEMNIELLVSVTRVGIITIIPPLLYQLVLFFSAFFVALIH